MFLMYKANYFILKDPRQLYQFHRTYSLINQADHINAPWEVTDIYIGCLIIQFTYQRVRLCCLLPARNS
jgi:hypothetical protein